MDMLSEVMPTTDLAPGMYYNDEDDSVCEHEGAERLGHDGVGGSIMFCWDCDTEYHQTFDGEIFIING